MEQTNQNLESVKVAGWEKLISFLFAPLGGIILYCCNHNKVSNPDSYWLFTVMGIVIMPALIFLGSCVACTTAAVGVTAAGVAAEANDTTTADTVGCTDYDATADFK